MLQVIREFRRPTRLAPGVLLRSLRALLTRLLTPHRNPWDEMPDNVRKDVGLCPHTPARDRTEAYWSDHRRHRDWMRSGPI